LKASDRQAAIDSHRVADAEQIRFSRASKIGSQATLCDRRLVVSRHHCPTHKRRSVISFRLRKRFIASRHEAQLSANATAHLDSSSRHPLPSQHSRTGSTEPQPWPPPSSAAKHVVQAANKMMTIFDVPLNGVRKQSRRAQLKAAAALDAFFVIGSP
jgi:hypothetical protein